MKNLILSGLFLLSLISAGVQVRAEEQKMTCKSADGKTIVKADVVFPGGYSDVDNETPASAVLKIQVLKGVKVAKKISLQGTALTTNFGPSLDLMEKGSSKVEFVTAAPATNNPYELTINNELIELGCN